MTTTATTPNLEFFQGTLSESNTRPQVTVRRGGLMVITRAAADMLGDQVTHVQLAFDAKTGTVGIRAAREDSVGAYRLRIQPKGPPRLVSGKRFFQYQGLTVDKAHGMPTLGAVEKGGLRRGAVSCPIPSQVLLD